MSSKSSTTRNRRNANADAPAAKPATRKGRGAGKPGAKVVAAAVQRETVTNTVVGRRLAFIADDKARVAAAKRFAGGESISKLATEFSLTVTRAAYCLRQQAVESGLVDRIDPTDVKAIKAARQQQDAAWVACRTGLSGSKLDAILEA